MASSCRQVTPPLPNTVFDFVTSQNGSVSFFCNDLNIDWAVSAQRDSIIIRLHTGPILVLASANVPAGFRVTAVARTIGSGFPPPQGSLLQLQTDTIAQSPAVEL